MSASDTSFVSEVPVVVVGSVVVVQVVVTSVVGAAVVSGAFFLSFPQAATITADRMVTEPKIILFFMMIVLLKVDRTSVFYQFYFLF